MSTLGESNVIALFSTTLDYAVIRHYGNRPKYMKGNLSGKADTVFADFFVGLPFSNVLIEFKDIETGAKTEWKKPLRIKFCQTLNAATLLLSLQCHFFGFGTEHETENFDVFISEYAPRICPAVENSSIALPSETTVSAQFFLQGMLAKKVGLDTPGFIDYLNFLAKLPDTPTGPTLEQTSFPAQLISFNDDRVMSLPIHTIADLRRISEKLSSYQSSTPPPPSNTAAGNPSRGRGNSYGTGGGKF